MTDVSDAATEASHTNGLTAPVPRFELEIDEPTGLGLQRIVVSQVGLASWHARRIHLGDGHIHGVRRTTKRVRAVLRMVRERIGEESYRENNVILRDAARELSDMRSAIVRIETLHLLVEWRHPLTSLVGRLNADLVADASKLRSTITEDPGFGERLGRSLDGVATNTQEWTLPDSMAPTAYGMVSTYRRGRRAMKTAFADPSVEHFHEWRKRVKYLRHQTEVISAAQPGSLSLAAGHIEEMGERLGLDHDLADLATSVNSDRDGSAPPPAIHQIVDAIAALREEIQTDLAPTALRLYGRSTREFATQMTNGWEEWHGVADSRSQEH